MRALKVIAAFIGGLIIGEALPIIWYIIATNYFELLDPDGGGAMGAIFLLGPLLAVIVGVTCAIVAFLWTKPRLTQA
jgi:hypothetical protein